MILKSLCDLYWLLLSQGRVAPEGYSLTKVHRVISLNEDGSIINIKSISPQKWILLNVPEQKVRTRNISSHFLCDTFDYFLSPGKQRDASAVLHKKLLSGINCPAAKAVCAFFDRPAEAPPVSQDSAKYVFEYGGHFVHDDPMIVQAWIDQKQFGGSMGRCCITGEVGPLTDTHPKIKDVPGTIALGGAAVSYNLDAAESFGLEGSANAPIGVKTAFAYSSALNYLLSSQSRHWEYNNFALVCWAENGDLAYQNAFFTMLFPPRDLEGSDIVSAMLSAGYLTTSDGELLSRDMPMFVLGVSGNAGRIAFPLFCRVTFGDLLDQFSAYHARMSVPHPPWEPEFITLLDILNEISGPGRNQHAPMPLIYALIRCIIEGTDYPRLLHNLVVSLHKPGRISASVIQLFKGGEV